MNPPSGPKVSQIANIFQRRTPSATVNSADMDTTDNVTNQHSSAPSNGRAAETHSTRFNNARALFEKLGVENRAPRPVALSLKMTNSSSKEDNLGGDCNTSPDRDHRRSPSPNRNSHGHYPVATNNNINGLANKRDPRDVNTKIAHGFRSNKSEKPEKPEKPERKFNSKELIEKQKNWTSHFTKARTTRFNSDPNRCDIIRSVPGTIAYPAQQPSHESLPHIHSSPEPAYVQRSKSVEQAPVVAVAPPLRPTSPPQPPIRHSHIPPEIKPRHTKPTPNSPCKSPPPPVPLNKPQLCSPLKTGYSNATYDQIIKTTASPTKSQVNTSKLMEEQLPEKRKQSIDAISLLDNNTIEEVVVLPLDYSSSSVTPTTNSTSLNGGTSISSSGSIVAPPVEYAQVKKYSVDLSVSSVVSPAHGVSSSPSPAPSSGPGSPIHTEDEKQENEPTEKAERSEVPPERK